MKFKKDITNNLSKYQYYNKSNKQLIYKYLIINVRNMFNTSNNLSYLG